MAPRLLIQLPVSLKALFCHRRSPAPAASPALRSARNLIAFYSVATLRLVSADVGDVHTLDVMTGSSSSAERRADTGPASVGPCAEPPCVISLSAVMGWRRRELRDVVG